MLGEVNDYDDGVETEQQLEDGGAWAVTYSMGNVTAGYEIIQIT